MDKKVYNLDKINSYSYLNNDMYIPISSYNSKMKTAVLSDLKEYINKDLSNQVAYLSSMVIKLQRLVDDLSTWKY